MVVVRIQGIDLAGRVARALGETPKELRSSVRKAIRPIGEAVLARARLNAGWSRRIPGALTLRVSFSRNPGVTVSARQKNAPHARPFEGITGRGSWRHPVFGNRDVWVSQSARPFLRPALDGERQHIAFQMEKAIEEAVTQSGLR